jgi:catechol 2,3-dioxygenase-like lactoylglutathione lyase family enzyme
MNALAFREFSHITVRVSEMERALAFYRDGLGLRVIFGVRLALPGQPATTRSSAALAAARSPARPRARPA